MDYLILLFIPVVINQWSFLGDLVLLWSDKWTLIRITRKETLLLPPSWLIIDTITPLHITTLSIQLIFIFFLFLLSFPLSNFLNTLIRSNEQHTDSTLSYQKKKISQRRIFSLPLPSSSPSWFPSPLPISTIISPSSRSIAKVIYP